MAQDVKSLTIALWAVNLGHRLTGVAEWAAMIDARMAEAKKLGADMLVMPEHASTQWLTFAPPGMTWKDELPWKATQTPDAVEAVRGLARKHDVALLAGSLSTAAPGRDPAGSPLVNRAYLFLPDGREIMQDKLCLTPSEMNPDAWNMNTGDTTTIVTWRGVRIAIVICLDIELPALSARMATHDVDLVLVPSMTERASGYHRVFGCAKARAVELMTAVCAVGVIGDTGYGNAPDPHVSGASVFLPCEAQFGFDGVAAHLPAVSVADGPGPMLVAKDVPVGAVRALRHGRPEVWPGTWNADHVVFAEA